ncbi:MAG: hypothetical protein ACPGVG_20620 [Mycobacterium sp.]
MRDQHPLDRGMDSLWASALRAEIEAATITESTPSDQLAELHDRSAVICASLMYFVSTAICANAEASARLGVPREGVVRGYLDALRVAALEYAELPTGEATS